MSNSSRAIVCRDTLAKGGWKMENVTMRPVAEGELLVEMVASGICHTDALIGAQEEGAGPMAFYPRILGHEGSGYVRQVGPGVTVAKEGDPVLCSFTYCNTCPICKANHHSHCTGFYPLNFGGPYDVFTAADSPSDKISGSFFGQSSFSHYSIVKSSSVVNAKDLVQSKRELQLFAPLGCGFQTGSGTVINVVEPTPSTIICVMGLGGVGLGAVMGAKVAGCKTIIGVDRVASRLKLGQEVGCTHVVDTSALKEGTTLTDAVRALAEDVGPDVTIDSTGIPFLIEAGIEFTRNQGRYVQIGTAPPDFTFSKVNAVEFMILGKQIIGAIEGHAYPPEYVPKMVQWYREGNFPIDKLIKFMPAEDFDKALKEMHSGETIKPVITWS